MDFEELKWKFKNVFSNLTLGLLTDHDGKFKYERLIVFILLLIFLVVIVSMGFKALDSFKIFRNSL